MHLLASFPLSAELYISTLDEASPGLIVVTRECQT